jgi:hypothetical protein
VWRALTNLIRSFIAPNVEQHLNKNSSTLRAIKDLVTSSALTIELIGAILKLPTLKIGRIF